jgi:hypothetical protein
MAGLGTFTIDLIVEGQPESCKKLYDAGWRFSYCEQTRFVSAEHPLGGKQSVVEVSLISRTEFDANDIGHSIAMMLNGGNHSR